MPYRNQLTELFNKSRPYAYDVASRARVMLLHTALSGTPWGQGVPHPSPLRLAKRGGFFSLSPFLSFISSPTLLPYGGQKLPYEVTSCDRSWMTARLCTRLRHCFLWTAFWFGCQNGLEGLDNARLCVIVNNDELFRTLQSPLPQDNSRARSFADQS